MSMANFAKRNKTLCLSKSNEDLPIGTSHYAISITRSCISIGELKREVRGVEVKFSDKVFLTPHHSHTSRVMHHIPANDLSERNAV